MKTVHTSPIRITSSCAFIALCGAVLAAFVFTRGVVASAPDGTLAAGLESYWPADGNANDAVGGNNGTLAGTVTFEPTQSGEAFSFDGSGAHVNFGSAAADVGSGNFTFAFWLETTQAGLVDLFAKRSICDHSNFWNLRLQDGHLVTELDQDASATNYVVFFSVDALNDGLFHHVAVVRRGTVVSAYVDGALDSSATSGEPTNVSNGAELTAASGACTGQDATRPLQGMLDEIGWWSRALTGDEIDQLAFPDLSGDGGTRQLQAAAPCRRRIHVMFATYAKSIDFDRYSGPPRRNGCWVPLQPPLDIAGSQPNPLNERDNVWRTCNVANGHFTIKGASSARPRMWVYDDTSSQHDDRTLIARCLRGDDDSGPNLGRLNAAARQNGYEFMAEDGGTWRRVGARDLNPSGRVLAYFAELYDSQTPGVYDSGFFNNWRHQQAKGWPTINVSMGGSRSIARLRSGVLTVCGALPQRSGRTRFVWLGIYSQTEFDGDRFTTVVGALNRCTGR